MLRSINNEGMLIDDILILFFLYIINWNAPFKEHFPLT